jgi:putative ABC transport system permease protein
VMWLQLALRNVLGNGRRSALVCATALVSVIALILFAGYVNATRIGLEYSTIRGGTGSFQVTGRGGFDGYSDKPLAFGLPPATREAIERVADTMPPGTRTVPRLAFSGLLSNGPITLSVSAVGVDPIAENAAFGSRNQIASGSALSDASPADGAVIGAELARRLGVRPGGIVTLMTTTVNGALNAQDLTIVGTVSTGIPQTELYLLQMKLAPAQRLLATDRLSLMAILLPDGTTLDPALAAIRSAAPRLETRTWRDLSPTYDQVVGLYEAFFGVFGCFILAVTAFSVGTAILTAVLERTREIGVLRSLGIPAAKVRLTFVIEAMIVTLAALAAGTIASAGLGQLINAMRLTAPPPPGRTVGYPFRIAWDATAASWIWLIVLVLTVAAAWLASHRVTKLRVVTALGAH